MKYIISSKIYITIKRVCQTLQNILSINSCNCDTFRFVIDIVLIFWKLVFLLSALYQYSVQNRYCLPVLLQYYFLVPIYLLSSQYSTNTKSVLASTTPLLYTYQKSILSQYFASSYFLSQLLGRRRRFRLFRS